jgi:predicted HicB family RNase H-like nuclease
MFRGEILNLNGGADMEKTPMSFVKNLKTLVFLEICKEKGISPTKDSGNFHLEIPPDIVKLLDKQ